MHGIEAYGVEFFTTESCDTAFQAWGLCELGKNVQPRIRNCSFVSKLPIH